MWILKKDRRTDVGEHKGLKFDLQTLKSNWQLYQSTMYIKSGETLARFSWKPQYSMGYSDYIFTDVDNLQLL